MRKILIALIILTGCTYSYKNIYSYQPISTKDKTVSVSSTELGEMHQELKQALRNAGYKLYVSNESKDYGYTRRTSHYEMADNVRIDTAVACSFTQAGYSYAISFIDLKTSEEVFSMQGQGCKQEILEDFNALIRNQYKSTQETEPSIELEQYSADKYYSIGGFSLWGK